MSANVRTSCLVVFVFLLLFVKSPVTFVGEQIGIETNPTFLCNLMDNRAVALGIRGADLGVSVTVGSKLWLIFGDTRGLGPGPPSGGQPTIGASSAIESQIPINCSSYSWLTADGKFFQPPLFNTAGRCRRIHSSSGSIHTQRHHLRLLNAG